MRPGFGKILPRMRAGIGGDETFRPVRRWTIGIVPLQRGGVVLPLVPEQLPELLDRRRILDQMIPVVMRDLVPEMAEQRTVRFAHRLALTLPLGRVGLCRVERNKAASMPGHDRGLARCALSGSGKEIKCETVWILRPRCQRQPQPQQRVKQAMLGVLDLAPMD